MRSAMMFSVLVCCAGVASAQVPPDPPAAPTTTPPRASARKPRATPVDANGEKLVCRDETVVGSRIPVKRVCTTVAERGEIERELRRNARRLGTGGCGPAGCS